MKNLLLILSSSLALLFFNGAYVYSQDQKEEDILDCFSLLFNESKFDSTYFYHNHINNKNCFFVIKNQTVEEFLTTLSREKDLFELKNGFLVSIDSQGRLFVWGIKRYLKFHKIFISHSKCVFVFDQIEYNGAWEKTLAQRKIHFEKNNGWAIVSDSISSTP